MKTPMLFKYQNSYTSRLGELLSAPLPPRQENQNALISLLGYVKYINYTLYRISTKPTDLKQLTSNNININTITFTITNGNNTKRTTLRKPTEVLLKLLPYFHHLPFGRSIQNHFNGAIVSRLWAARPSKRCSISNRDRYFFARRPVGYWGPPSLLSDEYMTIFTRS